jgi:hypothetical protein
MSKKRFTLKQANKELSIIKSSVEKLMALHRFLEILESVEIENETEDLSIEKTITELHMDFHKKMYFYHLHMRKMISKGLYVRDLDIGIIDFPSQYNGKNIFLSWIYGEDTITHWHESNCEFTERKPLRQLKKDTKPSQTM